MNQHDRDRLDMLNAAIANGERARRKRADLIAELAERGESRTAIAKAAGVSRVTVHAIIRGN